MSGVVERIRERARGERKRLVLVEGEDPRVAVAAARLASEGLAEVTLLCAPERCREAARPSGVDLAGVEFEDPLDPESIERTFQALVAARGERLTVDEARRRAADPLYQAAARVRSGAADCTVAGAVRSTAEVVRAALWLIGKAPGVGAVSSFFLMVGRDAEGAERVMTFADCGVIPDPTPAELAEIGCLAADNHERLTGSVPRVAFLSFSTHGSAEHPRVTKVREAVERARVLRPERRFDGELQADAALDPIVARRKAQDSPVAGRANVLVFPDLDAGNIGYKLVQRLAGVEAYGPILQGLARQANDLSRGCTADDVVNVSTIACVLSQGRAD